ncbi:conserved hypothetical protein [Bradyrhizobium oligotrophicum S58]|uniref:Uncharacterized protein n=1 Tax=Bradyrhizobium oligotrophicum S58 TaxID=1245469 RepID=M4Z6G7_9BRAD|nr:hypothetical protein [Bradyrhizobium oligotrophicum]BAM88767.1 conserved hypothetical protein [Bradyrhizobium oligotrophicum S58]
MPSDKPLPRLYVDFNEMLAPDLVLLSRHGAKRDANGEMIHLYEGLVVAIFSDDLDDQGQPDNLVAVGVVERNHDEGWSKHVKWCCRIGPEGIRHESDFKTNS